MLLRDHTHPCGGFADTQAGAPAGGRCVWGLTDLHREHVLLLMQIHTCCEFDKSVPRQVVGMFEKLTDLHREHVRLLMQIRMSLLRTCSAPAGGRFV